jgi:regulatory protein PHO2
VPPAFKQAGDASPSSAATSFSPVTPAQCARLSSSDTETYDVTEEEQQLSPISAGPGPIRTKSQSGPREKEKRKRSRVTPDQLVHLERIFATDRSPTAIRRREISELLGMNERQTQIWFQNRQVQARVPVINDPLTTTPRRAKAKLMEGRGKMPGALNSPLPLENPLNSLSSGMTAELQALLHEDECASFFNFCP